MKKPQREEIRTQSRATRRTRHHQESSHRVGSRRACRGTYLDLLGHCSSWRSARSGSRTHTEEDLHRILSPGRLPLSPSGLSLHPRRRTDLHAAAASVQRDQRNVLSLPRAAVQWQHRHARSPLPPAVAQERRRGLVVGNTAPRRTGGNASRKPASNSSKRERPGVYLIFLKPSTSSQ